ncbi:MAG: DUF4159 domain-containing protein [bacterium]
MSRRTELNKIKNKALIISLLFHIFLLCFVSKLPPSLPKFEEVDILPVEVVNKYDEERAIVPETKYEEREKVVIEDIQQPEVKTELNIIDIKNKGMVGTTSMKSQIKIKEAVEISTTEEKRYEKMGKGVSIGQGDIDFGVTKVKAKIISTPEGIKGFFKSSVVKWTSTMIDPYYGNSRPVYNVVPIKVAELIKEMNKRTGVRCTIEGNAVDLLDDELETIPFILFYGHVSISLTNKEKERLKKYLLPKEMGGMGGFAMFNDCMGPVNTSPFQKSAEGFAKEFFPEYPLKKIPAGHKVFQSFYVFTSLPSYSQTSDQTFKEYNPEDYRCTGVEINNRLVMILTPMDLVGRWLMETSGNHPHSSYAVRELCIKLGINIVMYSLSTSPMVDRTDYSSK